MTGSQLKLRLTVLICSIMASYNGGYLYVGTAGGGGGWCARARFGRGVKMGGYERVLKGAGAAGGWAAAASLDEIRVANLGDDLVEGEDDAQLDMEGRVLR
jgi:hypothetical protein